jgi:hypothetical protein
MVWIPKRKRTSADLMEKIALPKSFGGWGLKNIFLFSTTLAIKNVWRLIQGTCLWV